MICQKQDTHNTQGRRELNTRTHTRGQRQRDGKGVQSAHLIKLQVAFERVVVVANSGKALAVCAEGFEGADCLEDGARADDDEAALRW